MYSIGNIIIGTYLPEDRDIQLQISGIYCRELGLDDGDEVDWVDLDPWHTEYHGAAPWQVAWCGVRVRGIDVCGNFPLSDIMDLPSPKQREDARREYERLPAAVRELCPPFGVYVVWSTS